MPPFRAIGLKFSDMEYFEEGGPETRANWPEKGRLSIAGCLLLAEAPPRSGLDV